MKLQDNEDMKNSLLGLLESMRMQVSSSQAEKMLEHLDLVIEKNKEINLTRITNPEEAVTLHILDSLLLLPTLLDHEQGVGHVLKVLDLGTGAGYPGIPLHIATKCQMTLIDSVGKKVAAVDGFIDSLGLDRSLIEALHIRAEELAKVRRGQFDLVVARAVAQTNTLVEYATPLLKMGGLLVITKGNISKEEMKAGITAGKICGLKNVSRETFELPNDSGHREIVCFKKVKGASIKLPRNTGMAKHHPLGVN